MKKSIITLLSIGLAGLAGHAAITISVVNATPNGKDPSIGGSGTGVGSLTTSLGTIATDRGLPVTTYTVSNLDLTSVGGGASESFQFTMTYSQTGGTGVQFNSFGNVSVTGGGSNDQVDTTETLTLKIALTSSSFAGLSLDGFTNLRVGGFTTGEAGTFTYAGGSKAVGNFDVLIPAGIDEATLSVTTGAMNFQRFDADFVAVPEPATFALLAGFATLGLVMYRRRKA